MPQNPTCRRPRRTPLLLVPLIAVTLLAAACGGGSGTSDEGDASGDDVAADTTDSGAAEGDGRPGTTGGPAAVIGAELEGGEGISLLAAKQLDLQENGYVETEHVVTGTAVAYTAEDLPADGRFSLEEGGSADYATRIVVRRPADPADFNGTVLLEWLNVSSGGDAAPDFTYMAPEIVRGYAWVGMSVQHIGVEGGEVAVSTGIEGTGAGQGLKGIDPERYGELSHPGDAFSYDMYTQVARALRAPRDVDPLDGLEIETLLAIGESQSAFALTTYVNGVQPIAEAFDGFFVHSRGGAPLPLGEPGTGIGIAQAIGGTPTVIRDDLDVPTFIVQTEGDVLGVLGYLPARQPDSDTVRLWEIAGAAHADAFQVDVGADFLECPTPINDSQQTFVLRAALRHLTTWATGGEAPPEAPRLDVDESGTEPAFVTDEVGNVTGGVRTPAVDAPTQVLSGLAADDASVICLLLGSTLPLPDERLTDLYPTPEDYTTAYEEAVDAAVDAGYVLEEDRDELVADARPPA